MQRSLVGSEMCIRDRHGAGLCNPARSLKEWFHHFHGVAAGAETRSRRYLFLSDGDSHYRRCYRIRNLYAQPGGCGTGTLTLAAVDRRTALFRGWLCFALLAGKLHPKRQVPSFCLNGTTNRNLGSSVGNGFSDGVVDDNGCTEVSCIGFKLWQHSVF